MKRLAVIGSIVADTAVRAVDRMPEWGTATNVTSISAHLGGNGSGTAYAAGRLGAPVALGGAVGDDAAGRAALARLAEGGVDVSAVALSNREPTAQTVALIGSGGERLFLQQPGAIAALRFDDLDWDRFGRADGFHYASPFNLLALRRDAGKVLQEAKRRGMTTSMDLDWDPLGEWAGMIEPLYDLLDVLFLNRDEAERLTGLAEPSEAGRAVRERGVETVVLKLGAGGCCVFGPEGERTTPAVCVDAVDTTGAGDAFCGAFLAGLCRGLNLPEASRLAVTVASRCVGREGAAEGIPDYDEAARIAGLT